MLAIVCGVVVCLCPLNAGDDQLGAEVETQQSEVTGNQSSRVGESQLVAGSQLVRAAGIEPVMPFYYPNKKVP